MENSANMVVQVLDNAGQAATGFSGVLANSFTGIGPLFWTNAGPTILGALSMISVGATVVFFAFRVIRRLLRVR